MPKLVKELSASGAERVFRRVRHVSGTQPRTAPGCQRTGSSDLPRPPARRQRPRGRFLGHADVLGRLRTLGAALPAVVRAPASRLSRFAGYDVRFATALARAGNGHYDWVTRPRVDSCHTVWMELHEDLLATLGLERGAEPDR